MGYRPESEQRDTAGIEQTHWAPEGHRAAIALDTPRMWVEGILRRCLQGGPGAQTSVASAGAEGVTLYVTSKVITGWSTLLRSRRTAPLSSK
jgi:hypothetical protein